MSSPCEHCGNPDKSNWTSGCQYVGKFASRGAFLASTFDAPCSCDDYNVSMNAAAKRERVGWALGFAALIVIAVLLYII